MQGSAIDLALALVLMIAASLAAIGLPFALLRLAAEWEAATHFSRASRE